MIWGLTGTGSVLLQAADFKRHSAINMRVFAVFSASALLWGTTALAQNLPTGGTVSAGNVVINQPNANELTINQSSGAAIVNWNSFSIGSGSTVNIHQPGAQSVILNRVTGDTTSEIHGQLNANGQVHLVNPNGIFIGPNGHVNTAGFVASSLDISDEDFLSGTYSYQGNGNSAAVENAGTISIVPGGYAALLGGKVTNSGLIRVPMGKVGLGAGEQITLDISGDGFLQVGVPSDNQNGDLVTNSGRIEADGGLVELRAASARDAARQVINMSGVIEARSVGGVSGAVVLGGSGGAVRVSGTIDTSARKTLVASSPRPAVRPQRGGDITITGEAIALAGATLDASGAGAGDGGSVRVGGDYQGGGDLQTAQTTIVDSDTRILADGGAEGNGGRIIIWSDDYTSFSGFNSARGGDVSGDGGFVEVSGKIDLKYAGLTDTRAPNGKVGTLLLDPTNIVVSDDASATVDVDTLEANLVTGNVALNTSGPGTDAGDITINADIDWTSGTDLFLEADNNVILNGAINGSNGGLIIDAVGTITTGVGGTVNVGTFRLMSGFWQQVGSTLPSFTAGDFVVDSGANFLRALGGNGTAANPYQITDVYGLQGLGGAALSSQNFVLANNIDASSTLGWSRGFTPMDFSGTLDGNRFAIDGLFVNTFNLGGLFDSLSGTVRNLSITNADVTSAGGGILANVNSGTVSAVMTSGSYQSTDFQAGGLVGINNGTITDSFSTASVDADPVEADFVVAGGLVGQNNGNIIRSHSTGPVSGTLSFGNFTAGGLVGRNTGLVEDSYSTSSVSGVNLASGQFDIASLGGLVGSNEGGIINRTYSTGSVSFSGGGTMLLGGLVGSNSTGPVIPVNPIFNVAAPANTTSALAPGSVNASFWNSTTSGQTTSAGGGTALTTAQLQNTQTFFNLASAQGWDFGTTWAPGTGSSNPAQYSTSPVVFVMPGPLFVAPGQTGGITANGTVVGGPSTYLFGPAGDSLNTSPVFQSPTLTSTSAGVTTYTVNTQTLTSSLGQTYQVAALPGTAIVVGGGTSILPPPPNPTVTITPTVDTTITGGGGGGGTVTTTVTEATTALGTVEIAAQEFDGDLLACAEQGNDVSAYLACLALAMDGYASDLDTIVNGLPPGLEDVGDIIRDASAGIRAAGDEANRKLALATTPEERNAIRREAVQQARLQIRQAQREIRKAITLIRATDPELVSIQNQQVDTIIAAVGQAEIGLTRAVGL